MAKEFIPICDIDTRELRKEIGLPITKELQYVEGFGVYSEHKIIKKIVSYEIADVYMPSGAKSLLITLENGEKIRILGDYLVEMQSYSEEVKEPKTIQKYIVEPEVLGRRLNSFPKDYVVYDIETTGLKNNSDKIIELSAIKCVNGEVVDEYSKLVAIDTLIPKGIEKLTGITDKMLNTYGVTLEEAVKGFCDFVGNSILIGHNIASFDNHFISKAYAMFGILFKNDFVDTLYPSKKYIKGLDNYKLESMSKAFGISYEGAHRALVDCKINNEVYLRIAKLAGKTIKDVDAEIRYDKQEDAVFDNVVQELNIMTDELVKELKLPYKGIIVRNNEAVKYRSISVCANEPPYPVLEEDLGKPFVLTSLVLVNRPSTQKDSDKINVFVRFYDLDKTQIPDSAEVIEKTKDEEVSHYIVQFNEHDDNLISYVRQLTIIGIKEYRSKASSFGCCSHFIECSDAKECIHTNKLYSTSCIYRRHLEAGEIFYGKNANIE